MGPLRQYAWHLTCLSVADLFDDAIKQLSFGFFFGCVVEHVFGGTAHVLQVRRSPLKLFKVLEIEHFLHTFAIISGTTPADAIIICNTSCCASVNFT